MSLVQNYSVSESTRRMSLNDRSNQEGSKSGAVRSRRELATTEDGIPILPPKFQNGRLLKTEEVKELLETNVYYYAYLSSEQREGLSDEAVNEVFKGLEDKAFKAAIDGIYGDPNEYLELSNELQKMCCVRDAAMVTYLSHVSEVGDLKDKQWQDAVENKFNAYCVVHEISNDYSRIQDSVNVKWKRAEEQAVYRSFEESFLFEQVGCSDSWSNMEGSRSALRQAIAARNEYGGEFKIGCGSKKVLEYL